MDEISNPAHARRGDRRRTRRQVDEAFARGVITAADRATRMAHVEAATTKGDLAMVVRDLEGRQPPPRHPGQSGGRPAPPTPPAAYGAGQPSSGAKPAVVVAVVLGALGLVAVFAVAVVVVLSASSSERAVSPSTTGVGPSSSAEEQNLLTQQDWDRMLESLPADGDPVQVLELEVYRTSAWTRVVQDGEETSLNFTEGSWNEPTYTTEADQGAKTADLSDLDPELIDNIIASAAAEHGTTVEDVALSSVTFSGETPDRVQVMLTDTDAWDSYEDEYDLEGAFLR